MSEQSGPPQPGQVRFHLQGSAFTHNFVVPTVFIDGYMVPSRYGESVYPVVPGRHVIAAKTQWLRTYGKAHVEVDVVSGQTTDVWYAAPWSQFTDGSMGFEKQKRRGTWLFVGVMVLVVALVVLAVVFSILGSA